MKKVNQKSIKNSFFFPKYQDCISMLHLAKYRFIIMRMLSGLLPPPISAATCTQVWPCMNLKNIIWRIILSSMCKIYKINFCIPECFFFMHCSINCLHRSISCNVSLSIDCKQIFGILGRKDLLYFYCFFQFFQPSLFHRNFFFLNIVIGISHVMSLVCSFKI